MSWGPNACSENLVCHFRELFGENKNTCLAPAGEEIAHCPSCSLYIKVIYDPEDFSEAALDEPGSEQGIVVA